MNWSAYQTRVNEDESAEGRFTLAEPPSGDSDHLPQAANFKEEHCSYRSEREQPCHATLPWLISISLEIVDHLRCSFARFKLCAHFL